MKKILKVNYLTYFFILSACMCGMFKECIILFLIIIFHEFGHIIAIKYFGYKINYVEILPVGGITSIQKDINSSLNHEIIISLSGIFMQLVLFVISNILWQFNLLDYTLFQVFKKYNLSILVFNLLPIIPLDGSIFLRSLLEKIFSFYHAYIISMIISFISLVLFGYMNFILKLNNYIIVVFLFYKILSYIQDYKYIENRFYLERFLHDYNYSKIKLTRSLKGMQKQRKHVFKIDNKLYSEHTVLRKYFSYKNNSQS